MKLSVKIDTYLINSDIWWFWSRLMLAIMKTCQSRAENDTSVENASCFAQAVSMAVIMLELCEADTVVPVFHLAWRTFQRIGFIITFFKCKIKPSLYLSVGMTCSCDFSSFSFFVIVCFALFVVRLNHYTMFTCWTRVRTGWFFSRLSIISLLVQLSTCWSNYPPAGPIILQLILLVTFYQVFL